MPENQKKTPCSRITKRNPDSKPNSDTTPTSDGQIQWPDMSANGREIEISELTFRQQAALPRIALAQSQAQAARDTGVVGDFSSENGTDVVGIELLAAAKLLAQFCAVNESDALDSWKAASNMAPLRADFDKSADILTISTGRTAERSLEVGTGFVAHLGYANKAYIKKYSVVGFELHNASECLAPYFKLNR